MTSEPEDVFVASLKRCLAGPEFLKSFYDRFMSSSEEVREIFRNTDFKTQTRVLSESLFVVAILPQAKPDSPVWKEMAQLAKRHSRVDLKIAPPLYDLWLESLVDTAREHDPEFSPGIEAAWRQILSIGIEYMRSRY